MKLIKNMNWFYTLILLSSFSFGACFIASGLDDDPYTNGIHSNISGNDRGVADFQRTKVKIYHTGNCKRGHRALKKALKKEAKDICRANGSPSIDLLKCVHYYDESCDKYRYNGGKRVKVKGTLQAICR